MNLTYFKCIHCGKERKIRPKSQSRNKFCSTGCHAEYRWLNETKPRLLSQGCRNSDHNTVRRLLKELQGDRCAKCGTSSVWCEEPLTLHIDHIDGDCDNTVIDNLRLLCPNCHSQTQTYGSRNKRNVSSKRHQYYNTFRTKDVL